MATDKINNTPDVSVVMPVYNGERYLEEVLDAVFGQKTGFMFEVIVIDSGSSDRSIEIISKYPVRLHQIPNEEFGHGKTRNLGVRLAAGKYIVFLTQDATPASPYWLDNLVGVLEKDAEVAGAYSRQLPRPDCNPLERRDILLGTPPISNIRKVDFGDDFQRLTYEDHWHRFMVFSDVSSCVRKDIFERLPFNEEILMVEDQEWCKRAIESGYAVVYMAASPVYHSHNHSLKETYKRYLDYGRSFREFTDYKVTFKNVLFYALHESLLDCTFVMKQRNNIIWKIKHLVCSPLVRFAMRYGLHKGLNRRGLAGQGKGE